MKEVLDNWDELIEKTGGPHLTGMCIWPPSRFISHSVAQMLCKNYFQNIYIHMASANSVILQIIYIETFLETRQLSHYDLHVTCLFPRFDHYLWVL